LAASVIWYRLNQPIQMSSVVSGGAVYLGDTIFHAHEVSPKTEAADLNNDLGTSERNSLSTPIAALLKRNCVRSHSRRYMLRSVTSTADDRETCRLKLVLQDKQFLQGL
jgi:hypothetical protein